MIYYIIYIILYRASYYMIYYIIHIITYSASYYMIYYIIYIISYRASYYMIYYIIYIISYRASYYMIYYIIYIITYRASYYTMYTCIINISDKTYATPLYRYLEFCLMLFSITRHLHYTCIRKINQHCQKVVRENTSSISYLNITSSAKQEWENIDALP